MDYSFDVLTSRISNLGLYNKFYHVYFTYCLLTCSCMSVLTTRFQYMFMIRIYRYTCLYPCMPLGIYNTTRWRVLTPLDPHVQISELRAYGFSRMLIRNAQRKRGSSAVRLRPYPSRPPARLSSFLSVTCERPLYGSYLYISLYSHICAYR